MMKSKILFIDDEKEILVAYENVFKKKKKNNLDELESLLGEEKVEKVDPYHVDYEVFTATQGEEGVEIFKEHNSEENPFKIVFIDMRMPPGIDGAETAQRIRALDDKVEIVIITAYSDLNLEEINAKVKSPDKLFYLKKPFYNEEIKQITLNLTTKYINNEVKNRFVSNVSHELRTPLTSIIGFTKLLHRSSELKDEHRELLSIVNENASLMDQLIGELITTVKLQRNSLKLNKEVCQVKDLLKSVSKMMIPLFQKKEGVKFSTELVGGDLQCDWDPQKIKQVLINVMNNAIKFTEAGEIKLILEADEKKVFIKVQDTGMGISEDFQKRLFDQFSREEDTHHSVPGLGLGLNIVKQIVDLHDGEIEVQSELGQGSLFTLSFDQVA